MDTDLPDILLTGFFLPFGFVGRFRFGEDPSMAQIVDPSRSKVYMRDAIS